MIRCTKRDALHRWSERTRSVGHLRRPPGRPGQRCRYPGCAERRPNRLTQWAIRVAESAGAEHLDSCITLVADRRLDHRASPRFASAVELNQEPRWKVWIGLHAGFRPASSWPRGLDVGACPTATATVSALKRPTKVRLTAPLAPALRSPMYQFRPRGRSGTWIAEQVEFRARRQPGHGNRHPFRKADAFEVNPHRGTGGANGRGARRADQVEQGRIRRGSFRAGGRSARDLRCPDKHG